MFKRSTLSLKNFIFYVFPAVISMVLVSFYSAVDSWFLAHYDNYTTMAATNIVLPYSNLIWGLALMFTSGSCALVGIQLGEAKLQEAKKNFSTMFMVLLLSLINFSLLSLALEPALLKIMGATGKLLAPCTTYLTFIILGAPILGSKLYLEYYIRLDGSPKYALAMACTGFLANILIDWYTIGVLHLSIWGAAFSTVFSIFLSLVLGLFYFTKLAKRLAFSKPHLDFSFLRATLSNGGSELFSEISSGVITILFNLAILRFAGDLGVAAMAVNINIFCFLISVYIGIATGSQPLISYAYGADDVQSLRHTLKHCLTAVTLGSVLVFLGAHYYGNSLIAWYLGANSTQVRVLAEDGFKLFSLCFIFLGFNIFTAGIYTAIGNGKIATFLASLRSFLFIIICLKILPLYFGINGIWLTIPVAELVTLAISSFFYYLFYKEYLSSY